MVARLVSERFDETERATLYRVMRARRDVRAQFVAAEIPDEVVRRVLEAAHLAPSVGLMQPWRFILVRDRTTRTQIHASFTSANVEAARVYDDECAERYASLKLEGILDAPLNLCVVCDPTVARGHGLGRQTMPETAIYSTVCAVENLWLAARAEGLGVGWVSIVEPETLRRRLAIPEHVVVVAYLCMGYVSHFADEPDLARAQWERRVPLADVVDRERYGSP